MCQLIKQFNLMNEKYFLYLILSKYMLNDLEMLILTD